MIIEAAEAEMNSGSNPQMRLQIRRKDVNSMLYLDKPNAEKVIGDVTGKIREMEELAVQIDRLIVNQLPEYWKGASADKAQSTYAEEYKNFLQKKVPEMVTALKDYMQDCVKNITDVDKQLAGR